MTIQRITATVYAPIPEDFELPAIIPVFHRWIREGLLPGLPIDIANYEHVHDGPGIWLVGHDGDYGLHTVNGVPGFFYRHKREWEVDSLEARLGLVLNRLLGAVGLLERESNLNKLDWQHGELILTFPDRLNSPNNDDSWNQVKQRVRAAIESEFGVETVQLSRVDNDRRDPLTIQVVFPESPPLAQLLRNGAAVV